MDNLAGVYFYQEKLNEAEHLLGQVISAQKAKLRLDHPSILNSMHTLARNQGRFDEARKLQGEVVEA